MIFIAFLICRSPQVQDFTNMMLSWSQFCKEPLSERNFTFWEWFFAVMKVKCQFIQGLWSFLQFNFVLVNRNDFIWEWHLNGPYSIHRFCFLQVTKEHLRQPWNDGSIMGFVGRRPAEEMLKNSKSGTFLLRFSDSELGGVTIAWMYEDTSKGIISWMLCCLGYCMGAVLGEIGLFYMLYSSVRHRCIILEVSD